MIDLKPIFLKKVKNILAGHVPEFDVLVYGSRAAGTGNKYSYLDLAILTEKPLVAPRLEKMAAAFTAASLPFRVETIDWAATGSSFRKVVKKTGVLIQQTKKK